MASVITTDTDASSVGIAFSVTRNPMDAGFACMAVTVTAYCDRYGQPLARVRGRAHVDLLVKNPNLSVLL